MAVFIQIILPILFSSILISCAPLNSSEITSKEIGIFSFAKIIELTETDNEFANQHADAIREKLSKTYIKFITPFFKTTPDYVPQEMTNFIGIQQFEMALKVLSLLGHLMPSIQLEYYHSAFDKKAQIINELINYITSDTLARIHVKDYKNGFFDDISRPFAKVENVSIKGHFERLGNKALSFTDMFPSMRRLSMTSIKVFDPNFIQLNYPNLVHLHLEVYPIVGRGRLSEPVIAEFLKKNPQIQNIKLIHSSQHLLKVVASEVQHLEILELNDYNDGFAEESGLHFDDLKIFRVEHGSQSMPANTTFKRLEEFQSDAEPKKCKRWLEFVENSENLHKLTMNGRYLERDEVERLAAANLKLTEITIKCGPTVEDQPIIRLIENSTELKKINLDVYSEVIRKSIGEILRNQFNGWTINESGKDIYMEKND